MYVALVMLTYLLIAPPSSAGAAPQPQEQDDWPCANTLKDLSGAFGAASPTRGIRRFRLFIYFLFLRKGACRWGVSLSWSLLEHTDGT